MTLGDAMLFAAGFIVIATLGAICGIVLCNARITRVAYDIQRRRDERFDAGERIAPGAIPGDLWSELLRELRA